MATKITHPDIGGQRFVRTFTTGRRPIPLEVKAKRVNITLSPQAHKRGKELAKEAGIKFSTWIEQQIYPLTDEEIEIIKNTKREKLQADRRRYRSDNKDYIHARQKEWVKMHPESAAAAKANRRARKKKVGGVITKIEWEALCEEYGNKCLCCGRSDVRLSLDHVIPLDPGPNTIENAQPLCKSCNSKKGRKTIDFRKSVQIYTH